MSAKLFIEYNIGLNLNKKDVSLLIKCIENGNSIIFEYLINNNNNILTYVYNGFNIINYLFDCFKKRIITDNNIVIIMMFKIIKLIINEKINYNTINYHDNLNDYICFKILNSEISSENKILFFKLLNNYINPLEISTYHNQYQNTLNYPLIIHSMLLEELEITFILLNNLIKNGNIKKHNKTNESYKIFDYYTMDNNVNINFIPIVFKYIKDNHDKCQNFDNNNNNKIFTNVIYTVDYAINIIVNIMSWIIFFISYKKDLINDYQLNNHTENNYKQNKYMEITVNSDYDIEQINTITNTDESINKNNFKNKNIIGNKNIWVGSSIQNKKKIIMNKNVSNSTDSSNSSNSINSNVSISDILFNYN